MKPQILDILIDQAIHSFIDTLGDDQPLLDTAEMYNNTASKKKFANLKIGTKLKTTNPKLFDEPLAKEILNYGQILKRILPYSLHYAFKIFAKISGLEEK